MARRFVVKNRKKRKIILTLLLVLFVVLGIGYSAISTTLSIQGSLSVDHYEDKRLYTVLKNAAEEGTYASEYLGAHNDSPTGTGTEKIYYWDADTADNTTLVHDMDNVIFAGQCWQMIRTTDTGGVKMMYNGEAENGQCLTTRGNHIGFNSYKNQYYYPIRSYYFGTDYIYDSETSKFTLSGEIFQTTVSNDNIDELKDYYTCFSYNSASDQCSYLYIIDRFLDDYTLFALQMNSNIHYSSIGLVLQDSCVGRNCAKMIGYMYNDDYFTNQISSTDLVKSESLLTKIYHSSSDQYYFTDSASYVDGHYVLYNSDSSDPLLTTIEDFISILRPALNYQYFCLASNYSNGTCSKPYVYEGHKSNSALYITGSQMKDGYVYRKLKCAKTVTDNGDGTYTLGSDSCNTTGLITGVSSDLYYSKSGFYCEDHTSTTCSAAEMRQIVGAGEGRYEYYSMQPLLFGKSFTYDGSKYILNDTTSAYNFYNYTRANALKDYRYTCFNETGECSTINYLYGYSNSTSGPGRLIYVKNISDGHDVQYVLDLNFLTSNVNKKSSAFKSAVEIWYHHYLGSYSNYIEDTNYCNNRTISSYGGFDLSNGAPFMGSADYLRFQSFSGSTDSTSLYCNNTTDRFSVSNSSAPLQYPVGLITYPELALASYSNYWNVGTTFSSMSPLLIDDKGVQILLSVNSNGSIKNDYDPPTSYDSNNLRPVISLKNDVTYTSGVGSMEDPYIVNVE